MVECLIAQAERKFDEAMGETFEGRLDRAIIKFARAWGYAQLAFKLAENTKVTVCALEDMLIITLLHYEQILASEEILG